MSKHANLALHLDNTLLMMSLKSSGNPIDVSTSPGYTMFLPGIVIRVRLGSNFCSRTLQTTLLKEIYLCHSTGVFSRFMTKKVSKPATCCFLGPSLPLLTSCHRHPSLFVYDFFHTILSLGWLRIWRHSRLFPHSSSNTGISQSRINSDG